MTRDELAARIEQIGLDHAATAVAKLLTDASDEDQQYRDGIEDALNTLVQAGATDPR